MSLQFIMGGSGSGKTHYLYRKLTEASINSPGMQYFALVPEQFTMQTQKEIVSMHPNHGVMNIDIVSFARLAYRIFAELAVENPAVLDDMGKSMVLRKIAADKKKSLGIFEHHLNQTGFISQLKSMLSEFYQYGINEEMLSELVEKTSSNPLLEQKLKDLTVLYKGFKEYTEDKFITTEEILEVLCRVIPQSELIKNSIITLDGYTGFTPVQYRLLELFLIHCRQVIITITLDKKEDPYKIKGSHDLFNMSRQIAVRVSELAERHNVEKKADVWLDERPFYRFKNSTALDFMEQNIFRYSGRSYEKEQEEISIFHAADPGEEVEYAVAMIEKLIYQKGMRYRDIAIVTGDLQRYSEKLVYQFEKNKIPYFMDRKKSILSNPMVEVIRAALEIVQENFSYESVFRYLKTGLVTDDREIICRAENYVMAFGICGFNRWNKEWTYVWNGFREENLAELNCFRSGILENLIPFHEVLKDKSSTVKDKTRAVTELLINLHIEEKIKNMEEAFSENGVYDRAKEYSQVYEMVMNLFDRVVALLGDEEMGRREYIEVLDAGFAEIKVGLIPAAVDRVVAGDITRTRIDHVKVLFFLGVNDGIIPMAKAGGSVLNDNDREYLKQYSTELAPTAKEDGFMQRFYLYLMLTKPSDKLYISYSSASSDGKSIRPSYLLGIIKKMFPKIIVNENFEREILSKEAGKKKLINGLQQYDKTGSDSEFLELYRWFLQSEQYSEETKRLVEAAFYSYCEKGIGRAAAKALYGNIISGSVTRLEKYAACAYAHFLAYGIELAERREYEIAAADMGNLFHSSIDLFFREMKEQQRDWRSITEAERRLLVEKCVLKVTEEYGNTILQSSARNAYLSRKILRITDRTVWALGEQIKKGDFNPSGFEVSFSAADNLKAMKIKLTEEEELHLRGRIDRVDTCEDDEHVYIKIIDYKSGTASFDLAALYYGLQLQLVVYMDAAIELEERKQGGRSVVPAGIFYYNINDPVVDKAADIPDEEIEHQILKQLRMNGLVNSDIDVIKHIDSSIEKESDVIPVVMKSEDTINELRSSVAGGRRFEALRGYVQRKLYNAGIDILSGYTAVNPYKQGKRDACAFCPYHAVCSFDIKIPGYRYHKFKALKPDEIWSEIEGGEHHD